jgi:hypothetical protein
MVFLAGMAFTPHGYIHLNEAGLSGRGQKEEKGGGRLPARQVNY